MIEKYLKAGNKCPISGVELSETDLLNVQGRKRKVKMNEIAYVIDTVTKTVLKIFSEVGVEVIESISKSELKE